MSTYKNIIGKYVRSLTADPTDAAAEGQIWYNSTTGVFKSIVVSEAWASGNSMLTGRYNLAGSGTQTAGLIAGGTTPGIVTNTEHFDGIGWRNGGALNVGRDSATMFGLSTAATFVGGYAPSPNGYRALVEEYNGSAWSEETNLPTPRAQGASAGTQTDGIIFGGNQGPPGSPETTSTTTLEYNGSSWTTGGAMSVNDRYLMGCGGSQAQALRIGGESDTDATEEYDGSSWTTGGNLNTGRYQGAASGTNTAGLVFGGNPNRTNTEGYDGTSWSNKPVLATGVEDTSGSAQGTNAEAFQAGQSASPTSIVQNWNSSINAVTASAWSSSTAINTARNSFGGFGLQTANIIAGGYGSPNVMNETESWDGTSWTEVNNLNTARSHYGGSQASPYTAAVIFKGNTSASDTSTNATEEWDGTNWTTVTVNPTTGQRNMGAGTQTAALSFGGVQNPAPPAPKVASTQEYDGTNWTSGGDLNTARNDGGGTGTQTAGLAYGGDAPGASSATEEYDGSSWTSVNNMVIASGYYGECGQSQTDAMAVGNLYASPDNGCQYYNGTTWSTRPLLGTARFDSAGSGTGTAAMVAGGGTPGNTDAVEEFNGETTALNVKTLTTS